MDTWKLFSVSQYFSTSIHKNTFNLTLKSMFHLWGFWFDHSTGSKYFSFHVSIFLLLGLHLACPVKTISTWKLKRFLPIWKSHRSSPGMKNTNKCILTTNILTEDKKNLSESMFIMCSSRIIFQLFLAFSLKQFFKCHKKKFKPP